MRKILLVTAILFCVYSVGSKTLEIESKWSPQKINIDGELKNWSNPFFKIPDNSECAISFANDSSNLYICITSNDQNVNRHILMSGLFITASAEKKRDGTVFGIHYPIGFQNSRRPEPSSFGNDEQPPHPNNHHPDDSQKHEFLEQMLQAIELIGPKADDSKPMAVTVAETFGIKAKFISNDQNIVYEFQIPLKNDSMITGPLDLINKKELKIALEIKPPEIPMHRRAGESEKHDPFQGASGIQGGRSHRGESDGNANITASSVKYVVIAKLNFTSSSK